MAQFSLGSRVAAATVQPRAPRCSRAVVLEEDAWLNPRSEQLLPITFDPPFKGNYRYEAILKVNRNMRFGSRQDGVGVAETLLTVSPGCSNFTPVLNVANQPIQVAKGTVIGHIEELTPDTTVETVASYEKAQHASAGTHTVQSAADASYSSTRTAAVKASRTGSDPEPSPMHYPVRATVSDEQIQSLLKTGVQTHLRRGPKESQRHQQDRARRRHRRRPSLQASSQKGVGN